jgi:hypothetical protein
MDSKEKQREMKLQELRMFRLAKNLFKHNQDGVEFLELLKKIHVDTPVFPMANYIVENHGGPLGWAAFREGKIDLVRQIEHMANDEKKLGEDNQ